MATNVTHGSTATPSKDSPPNRGRDGFKATQDDDNTERTNSSSNSPPDHGKSTNPGKPSTFLEWLHPQTPCEASVLQQKWNYWQPRSLADGKEPATDPRPTWADGDGLGEWSE